LELKAIHPPVPVEKRLEVIATHFELRGTSNEESTWCWRMEFGNSKASTLDIRASTGKKKLIANVICT